MIEKRAEPRNAEAQLPPMLQNLAVHTETATFFCRVVDAGSHGLGLVSAVANRTNVSKGQVITLDFGSIVMKAEVLYLTEGLENGYFRLGVFLLDRARIRDFQKLISKK